MSFIPLDEVKLTEFKPAKILAVGDCPDVHARNAHTAFAYTNEKYLTTCLHQAGLTSHDVVMCNLLPEETNRDKFWKKKGARPTGARIDVDYIKSVIEMVQPNVIVAMGDLAFHTLTGKIQLHKRRGYVFPCAWNATQKVIGTFHVNDTIWKNQIWRHYIAHDFLKAKRNSETKEFLYPKLQIIYYDTAYENRQIIEALSRKRGFSFDLEVSNYEISCIGYCPLEQKDDIWTAFVVPFDERYSEEDEVLLWRDTDKLLSDPNTRKICQNGIFDIQLLVLKMGIITRGVIEDTMIAHSIIYPDYLKSLGFLGSIYTELPYWKDMIKWNTIKEDA